MREYVRKALGASIMLAMIPGCTKQPNEKNKAALSQKQAAFSFAKVATNIDVECIDDQAFKAKLDDIPTYVGSHIIAIDNQIEDGQLSFSVACDADQNCIKDFYMQEMEICGWQKMALLVGDEIMIIFQKPKKICIITLEKALSKTNASIAHIKVTDRIEDSN